ncbi:helix-turn-helix transcriptional regulator [Kribbella swartbergensis]
MRTTGFQSLGRDAELDAARAALAGDDSTSTLLIVGDEGLGKTTFLRDVLSLAGHRTTLSLTPVEFESSMPYAGLHEFLAPHAREFDKLPQPQRRALETAFGYADGTTNDRFLVGLATASILAATAPAVCLVDDAQWLDEESARALAVASRRLDSAACLLVLATRPDPRIEAWFSGARRLDLTPLGTATARRILDRGMVGPLDPVVADQIVAEARGNPLVLQLLTTKPPAALAGGFGVSPLGPTALMDMYWERVQALPRETQKLVLLAAADPTGSVDLFRRACGVLGLGAELIQPAVDDGLLELSPRLCFAHPTIRSVVYLRADSDTRRAVHAALAAVTDRRHDPVREVWHRSQAARRPDADLVRDLAELADDARVRGGPAAAASFLSRAASLSSDPDLVARLQHRAAEARRDAGDLEGARALAAAARIYTADPRRLAEIRVLEARTDFERRYGRAEAESLFNAASALWEFDPQSSSETMLRTLAATMIAGPTVRSPSAPELARRVLALTREPVDSAGTCAIVLDALALSLARTPADAVPAARRAVDHLLGRSRDGLADVEPFWLWLMTSLAWDDDAAVRLTQTYLDAATRQGRMGDIPIALNCRATLHLHAGEIDDAIRLTKLAAEARELTGAGSNYVVDLPLAAWRGKLGEVQRLSRLAQEQASRHGGRRILSSASYAQMVLFNGLCRYDRAISPLPAREVEIGFHASIPPEQVEAAVRVGDGSHARDHAQLVREYATAAATPWASGMDLRCRALLEDDAEVESLYLGSIEVLGYSRSAVQRARSQLLYGEWLRRRRRPTESRAVLREAYETFSALAAEAFAQRAARELRALGEETRSAETRPLTAQQLAVARLAAKGITTREIAGILTVSPRTVDTHLRSIFGRLGVTSRRQIGEALEREYGSQRLAQPSDPSPTKTPARVLMNESDHGA